MERIFKAFAASENEAPGDAGFGIVPLSLRGRLGLALLAIGFLIFLSGVLSASVGFTLASQLAVGGVLIFFGGGLLRVYSD